MKGGFFPWEEGVLLIAVDPAQKKSAFAYRGRGRLSREVVSGVFHVDDIRYANLVEEQLSKIAEEVDFSKVVLGVEFPCWNAGAAGTVRAAAHVWIRLVKALFPRKVVVSKIDPNTWQGEFRYRDRPSIFSTKTYSVWIATKAYGWEIDTEDEADAAMILEYLRTHFPAPPKKKSKKLSTPPPT